MSGQHTPGPWSVADGRATGFKTASGGESILANARPTDDFFILKIAEMETNVSAAERAANARLIAAAPDMLAALLGVQQSTEWSCMETDTQDAVLAAIANATTPTSGEAQ